MRNTLCLALVLCLLACGSRPYSDSATSISSTHPIRTEQPELTAQVGRTEQTGLTQRPRSETYNVNRTQAQVDTLTIPGTDVQFTMALLPEGTFLLGSPESEAGREPDEGPQRTVIVQPFWIGTHEVTFDEFAVFRFRDRDADAGAAADYTADAVTRPSIPYEDPAHGMGSRGFPATGMTQWAALQFARWLSAKTGDFYRLPTEAEWEYACRAGSTTAYSFADEPSTLDAFAWHLGNSDETFHEVGQKNPNAWGLFDMHGNVSEWTLDQYDSSFYASLSDQAESPWAKPTHRHPRTVRGGAFDDEPDVLRCADRLKSNLKWKRRDPQIPKSTWWNTDSPFVGFRLVRPVNPPSADEIAAFWELVLAE